MDKVLERSFCAWVALHVPTVVLSVPTLLTVQFAIDIFMSNAFDWSFAFNKPVEAVLSIVVIGVWREILAGAYMSRLERSDARKREEAKALEAMRLVSTAGKPLPPTLENARGVRMAGRFCVVLRAVQDDGDCLGEFMMDPDGEVTWKGRSDNIYTRVVPRQPTKEEREFMEKLMRIVS